MQHCISFICINEDLLQYEMKLVSADMFKVNACW